VDGTVGVWACVSAEWSRVTDSLRDGRRHDDVPPPLLVPIPQSVVRDPDTPGRPPATGSSSRPAGHLDTF
jgi:hypothetical protein